MLWKEHQPEEVAAGLRQVDVLVSQGSPVADAGRQIGAVNLIYGS